MTAPLVELAAGLCGRVVATDDGGRVVTPDGAVIYCNFLGAVRVQRYGRPVTTLGMLSDGVPVLVAAYQATVTEQVA